MVGFAARDILDTIRKGLDLLKDPMIQRSVGAHTLWGTVQNIAVRYLNGRPDIATHVRRGQSGMIVLAWLAEVLPRLSQPADNLAPPGHPAVAAAVQWLQSSYALSEGVESSTNRGA